MENIATEWKERWKDEYLKVICAFSNSQTGGTLYIGIDDNGNKIGVKDPKSDMKKIFDTTVNTMGLYPTISLDEEDNVIKIDVKPSRDPVELRGKYYTRIGNTIHELKGRELERFIVSRSGTSWMDLPLEGLSIDDLDRNMISAFRKMATKKGLIADINLDASDEELLLRLNLISNGHPTRTAALLFHPEPESVIRNAFIRISMSKGSEILYQDEINGPFLTMPDRIYDLLVTKYSRWHITYDGLRRIDNEPYPQRALRECLVNAIMHNDYSSEISIQIRVWDDEKMMISDTGRIPLEWTLDTLIETHMSIPFNPILAKVFSYAGYGETWGRGIEHILECYNENDEMPKFDVTASSFSITLFNKTAKLVGKQEHMVSQTTNPLGPTAKGILNALGTGKELTSSEIMTCMGVEKNPNFTSRKIMPLVKSGLVEKATPDKTHSRNQRYRLTTAGWAMISRND